MDFSKLIDFIKTIIKILRKVLNAVAEFLSLPTIPGDDE